MTPKTMMRMKLSWFRVARATVIFASALLMLSAAGAMAQDSTLIVLRAVSAKAKKGSHLAALPPVVQSDVAEIKVGGKPVDIKSWTPLLKEPIQLVVLIDSMEQIGVNEQFDDMKKLFKAMPPTVEISVGYLLKSKAHITQPFTTDRDLAGAALKEPQDTSLTKNDNGSPYECLKDLASHWENPDPKKLRMVLMFTDGIDRYNSFQGGDQNNPDVDAAAQTLMRAGVMPFPFFYMDPVTPQGRNEGGQLEGQSNFDQLTAVSQGYALYEGQNAPSTFDPLLNKFYSVLNSMAVAEVDAKGSGLKTLDIKSTRDDIKVIGPDSIVIGNVLKSKK